MSPFKPPLGLHGHSLHGVYPVISDSQHCSRSLDIKQQ